MTALIMFGKAIALIVLALTAYAGLAILLGYEPAAATNLSQCKVTPAPVCLFTII